MAPDFAKRHGLRSGDAPIYDNGNFGVGVYGHEISRLLLAVPEIHGNYTIDKPQLLQCDRNFEAVRRGESVDIDHKDLLFGLDKQWSACDWRAGCHEAHRGRVRMPRLSAGSA